MMHSLTAARSRVVWSTNSTQVVRWLWEKDNMIDDGGLVLSFSMQWLQVPEAFAVICVCRRWKSIMTLEEPTHAMWKQVCLNTQPAATAHVNANFHRLAQGLGRSMVKKQSRKVAPTLQPDDLFAVVEIYRREPGVGDSKRRRISVASWTCPVTYPDLTLKCNMERIVILNGTNPYFESIDESYAEVIEEWKDTSSIVAIADSLKYVPVYFALCDALGGGWFEERAIRAKVTLFRRDTMSSVCVMDEAVHPGITLDLAATEDLTQVLGFFWGGSDTLHFSNDGAGCTAKRLMYDRGFSAVRLEGDFTFTSTLAAFRGSTEEPAWLQNMNKAIGNGSGYFPSQEDQRALASIPCFGFEIESFNFQFTVSSGFDGFDEGFGCEEDLMVALEGLCWK